MSQTFTVMETNPNQPSSNACLCSDQGTQDTKGPFIVFSATSTDHYLAPYPVMCAGCVFAAEKLVCRATDPTVAQFVEDSPEPGRRRKRSEDGPTI